MANVICPSVVKDAHTQKLKTGSSSGPFKDVQDDNDNDKVLCTLTSFVVGKVWCVLVLEVKKVKYIDKTLPEMLVYL